METGLKTTGTACRGAESPGAKDAGNQDAESVEDQEGCEMEGVFLHTADQKSRLTLPPSGIHGEAPATKVFWLRERF